MLDFNPHPTRRRCFPGPDDGRCVLRGSCASVAFVTIGAHEFCAVCGANSVSGHKISLMDLIAMIRENVPENAEVSSQSIDHFPAAARSPETEKP